MRGARVLLALFVSLLAGSPVGLAAPGQGALEFEAPGWAYGVGNVTVPADSHLAFYGIQDDVLAELVVGGENVRLTQTTTSEEFVAAGPGNWGAVPGTANTERTVIPLGAGRISLTRALANLTLVLSLDGEARIAATTVRLGGPVDGVYLSSPGWPVGPKTLEPFPSNVADWPNRESWVAPGPRHHLSTERAALEYVGAFSLLLSGAEVHVTNASEDRVVRTGSWREPAPDDPTGLTTGQRYRSHHVMLSASLEGSLRLAYAGPYGHVVPVAGALEGTRLLSVPVANATFDFDGGEFASRNGSFLDVGGLFDVDLAAPRGQDVQASRVSAHVRGEIASISENRAAPIRFDPRTALLVAGGATALAALLAFTAWGREVLTVVLGRNVTTPLAHPLRVRLLEEIAKRPGITQSQLAAQTGVGLWLARYHLRILRRGRVIDVVRSRAADTFFLNGGSFRFYAPTTPAPAEAHEASAKVLVANAFAELHHPVRRQIFETLRRTGPASYAQMAASSERSGQPFPPAPSVSYHAGLLARAGLVRRRREGRQVVWSLNVDLYNVLDERARRCLSDPGARRVFALLNETSGLTVGQIATALGREAPAAADRTLLGEALARLERSGLVVRDEERNAYTATPGLLTPDLWGPASGAAT